MNKIRILLIDDKPNFSWDDEDGCIYLPDQWEDLFELQWIQNPQEARWLLDSFNLLSNLRPDAVSLAGLPPEILVFDYALTGRDPLQRTQMDPTNIAVRLENIMREYGLKIPPKATIFAYTGAEIGKDRMGCYIGGEFARTFGNHPCGAIPTTALVDTSDTDAAFYEWLNQAYFQDLFKDKSRPAPTWDNLISLGVKSLRERIIQLAGSGLIRVSEWTVQRLIENPETAQTESLSLHSRFGRRDLPITGLFADCLPPCKQNRSAFVESSKAWAQRMVSSIFNSVSQNEFADARNLAEQYYTASTTSDSCDRYELSGLAAKVQRTADQEQWMEELCNAFKISIENVRQSPDKVTVKHKVLKPLPTAAKSPLVARYAALMIIVRAEQVYRYATTDWLKFKGILTEYDKSVGEVNLADMQERLGKTEATRLIKELNLQRSESRNVVYYTIPPMRGAQIDDVYHMLDPLPESLFTFFEGVVANKGKNEAERIRKRDAGRITQQLKRLGRHDKKKTNWGPLGLNLINVLENRPFACPLCRDKNGLNPPDGEHEDENGVSYSHGLRVGEGHILKMYADLIEFPESEWPTWLSQAH